MKKVIVVSLAVAMIGLLNNCAPKVAKQTQASAPKAAEPVDEGDVPAPALSTARTDREEAPTPIWDQDQDAQMATIMAVSDDAKASGKQLYERKCGSCHKLHATQSRTSEAWHPILKTMRKKAALNEAEYTYIAAYIHANAKQ